ncbi:MAG: hypothetical protein KC731_32580, partial [Myxococcales bacterium]|nr:hypothetical protein [Myxococcales bacterium]
MDTKAAPPPPWGHFVYHPRQAAKTRDSMRLPDGARLHVGDGGERWLQRGDDWAQSTPHRPDEDLVAARAWDGPEGRFLFLGSRGGVYFAAEPLGPLTAGVPAPRRLRSVVAEPQGMLATDALGEVHRFDGTRWRLVSDRPRIYDFAPDRGGLVGLGLPEALWRSDDAGASWHRLPAERVGTMQLTPSADGLIALGGRSHHRLTADGRLEAVAGDDDLEVDRVRVPHGPSGAALHHGHAALHGEHYRGLVREPSLPTVIVEGRLGEPMNSRKIALPEDCLAPLVAHAGDHLWIACTPASYRYLAPISPKELPESSPQRIALYYGG